MFNILILQQNLEVLHLHYLRMTIIFSDRFWYLVNASIFGIYYALAYLVFIII